MHTVQFPIDVHAHLLFTTVQMVNKPTIQTHNYSLSLCDSNRHLANATELCTCAFLFSSCDIGLMAATEDLTDLTIPLSPQKKKVSACLLDGELL